MPIKKQTIKSNRKPAVRRAVKNTVSRDVKAPDMVSFGTAVANFFKKYFTFSGVATRAEFWWVFLFMWIMAFGLIFVSALIVMVINPVTPEQEVLGINIMVTLFAVFYIATLCPWYALMARRLHDIGVSAKWLFISVFFGLYSLLTPVVVPSVPAMFWLNWMWIIILLVSFLFPSKTKNNPYRN